MENNNASYVQIKPETNGIAVNWSIQVLNKKTEDGRLACFIPSLNIYFTAKDTDNADQKSVALSNIFFDHFFIHSKNGLKKVVLELHKLGFKTTNDAYVISQLSHNRVIPAKFNSNLVIPASFIGAGQSQIQSKRQILA